MPSRPFVPLDEVARECFNSTVSLFWGYPEDDSLRSATGFFIELDGPFLFTARHVIEAFLEAKNDDASLELKVGKGYIDRVRQRVVDRNQDVDMVALNLEGIEISSFKLNHIKFFKPKRWPPNCVSPDAQVFFIGFVADKHRTIDWSQGAIRFHSFTVCTEVGSVSNSHFDCPIIMEKIKQNTDFEAQWPTVYGGLSGSPVFVIREDRRPELTGIVFEELNSFDTIRAHHSKLFNSNGTLGV